MITIQGPDGDAQPQRTVSGNPLVDTSVSFTVVLVPRVTSPGSTSQVTVEDKVISRDTGATSVTDYQLFPEFSFFPTTSLGWESSNESIATVSESGFVSWQANGSTRIFLKTKNGDFSVKLTLATSDPSVVDTVIGYASGSAGRLAWDSAIDLATAGGQKNVFISQNHETSDYVRNPLCWASLDWSGVSPWNSHSANLRAGTAIGERLIIFANHYPIPNGTTVRFVDNTGSVVERIVTTQQRVGDTDIQVGLLDSSLPSEIRKYAVLPSDFAEYLPATSMQGILGVAFDQEEKAIARFMYGVRGNPAVSIAHVPASAFPSLTEPIVTGDSGNPMFVIFGEEPVLLGCHHTAGTFPHIGNFISDLDAAISILGAGTYTLFDLSEFTQY